MVSAIVPPAAKAQSPGRTRRSKALIWSFCLLLVVGMWWFIAGQVGFERQQAIEDTIRRNESRVVTFELYVRRTLEAADLVTQYVAGRFARGNAGPEFVGTPDHPARIAGQIASGGPFLSVSIADARGNLVANSLAVPVPPTNVADQPPFRAHLGQPSRSLYISAPMPSRVAGRNMIWLSRRLNNPDGSFAGVIAINIPPEQLISSFRGVSLGQRDILTVTGLDGIIRARLREGQSSSGGSVAGTTMLRHQMENPNGTYLSRSPLDGELRYFSHRRLHDYPLFVTYGVSQEEVLSPWQRRANIFYVGGGLVTLLLIAFAVVLTIALNRRERREAALARANERLSEAQRIGQIGDWDYDLITGEVYWSPQLCAQFGRDPEQGSPTFEEFRAYLTAEGREAIDRAHATAIRTGEVQEVEYEVHLPGGVETRHLGMVMPGFDADGKVVRLHGTDQNIAARKLLDRLQTHVAHLSRVEAMNAMATTLAHELNQPLTAASNYLIGSRRQLRRGGDGTADAVREGLEGAEQQVQLAAGILRRVREMVANQPRAVTNVALDRVVEDALALVAIAGGGPRPAVTMALASDARNVRADRIQLQQVLINLLGNACEATDGRENAEIIVTSVREGDMVSVTVADNGTGFSRPAEERFSPFATTRPTGLGLGLSISRTIIESHGGRIWTEDREGGGAVVGFTLPASRGRRPRAKGEH